MHDGDARAHHAGAGDHARRELICVLLLGLGLIGFFPYFPQIHSANELSRLFLADALVVDHSVRIDGAMKRWGNVPDRSKREGHYYSDKAPGVAFLAAPALWVYIQLVDEPTLADEMRLARLVVSTLPTLLFFFALLAFLRERIADEGVRVCLLLGYGAGSLATTYGILLFGHQLSAVLIFGLFLVLRRATPDIGPGHALGVGTMAAAAVIVEYQNALFLLPLGFLYLWQVRARPRAIALALVGMLPLSALLLAYHQAAFGSPFLTGYSFLENRYFQAVHARGMLGIETPRLAHAALSFVSPAKGLFFFSPFLALALPGLALLRPTSRDALVTWVMVGLYALFVTSMVFPGGGWTVSQRHLTPLVPWLLWPVGAAVSRWTMLRGPLLATLALSLVITGSSTVVWPYLFDSLRNPFFQLAWPLVRDGYFPPSIASTVGVSSRLFFLVLAGLAAGALLWVGLLWYARGALGWRGVAFALLWVPCQWLALQGLHSDQDVRKERARVERDYVLDARANPVDRGASGPPVAR